MYDTEEERVEEQIGRIIDHLPGELVRLPQCVNWRYEDRGEELTKRPYHPRGWAASHSNASSWSAFRRVLRAYATGKFAGVGFVFSEDDPYCGLDFDAVRDVRTGAIEPTALAWLRMLDSYTEISPSGAGLKVWIHAELPPGRHKRPGLEIYAKQRFFTVTGALWTGSKPTIEARQAELEKLIAHEFPKAKPQTPPHHNRRRRSVAAQIDLGETLATGNVEVFGEIADQSAEIVYQICCPWWEEHTAGDKSGTRVGQYADGGCFFCCEHAHCAGRGWQEFVRAVGAVHKINRESKARRVRRVFR